MNEYVNKPDYATDKHLAEFARCILRHTFNGTSFMDGAAFEQDMPLRRTRSAAYVESRFPGCRFHAEFAKDVNNLKVELILQTEKWRISQSRPDQRATDNFAKAYSADILKVLQNKYAIKRVAFSLVSY